ncbi:MULTISPECIES: CvpA family protein [Salegentibacter]|jgi:membrane protein required for colicin V production|uniref:Membrane protein required for colicin V production n=1 Tax=Salegentibacter agarivorans TaxID=345907 RepID=A0A1I2MFV6_9FLAO|nr:MULTISPECIES: CvpA family protein [Salegentibacter]APS38023.1 colicin V production protein [Salegentibacter sp. T436]SFF88246.1 membrane protein required for colicin V production [Salegentibacter agarivorans]
MNTVDIVLALILLYGLVRGFFRGLLAEIASLVGIVAGIYGAIHFSHILSDFFSENMNWDSDYVNLIAFAITFILIVFLISLAGKILTKMAGFAALGIVNKLLGGAFGLLKMAFLASVVIMFFGATNEEIDLVSEESLEESKLYAPVKTIAPAVLPSIIREARERDILNEENDFFRNEKEEV